MRRDLASPDINEEFGVYTLKVYELKHDECIPNPNSPAGRGIWGPATVRLRIWEDGRVSMTVERHRVAKSEHQIKARGKS